MKKYLHLHIFLVFIFMLLTGCKKEIKIYEINPVDIENDALDKSRIKGDLEFVSIAYRDVYGTTIPASVINSIGPSYISFGDKKVMADMVFKNFINDPDAIIPTNGEMNANPDKFVEETYVRFLIRRPNAFEKWFLVNKIETDTNLTSELIWYSFLTCNEYQYY